MASLQLSTQLCVAFHRGQSSAPLFLLYTADVASTAQKHRIAIHSYTDNTQLYASCPVTAGSTSAALLLCCIHSYRVDWMTPNHLKLNTNNTQFIWLGSLYYTASVSHLPLSVGDSTVFPDNTVRNLGVMFDMQFTNETPRQQCDAQLLVSASSVTF